MIRLQPVTRAALAYGNIRPIAGLACHLGECVPPEVWLDWIRANGYLRQLAEMDVITSTDDLPILAAVLRLTHASLN